MIIKLQANNVGETFIQNICDYTNIKANINGARTKTYCGSIGDGVIYDKTVEIKTSHRGCKSPNFQHEMGESPWISNIIMFIDITPSCIYLTIFNNFTEELYKSGEKMLTYISI